MANAAVTRNETVSCGIPDCMVGTAHDNLGWDLDEILGSIASGDLKVAGSLLQKIPERPETAELIGELHNLLGMKYKARSCTHDAELNFLKAVKISPQLADAHYNLGNLYFVKQEFDLSVSRYLLAISISPGEIDYLTNLSICLGNCSHLDNILKWIDQLVMIEGITPDGLIVVARNLNQSAQWMAAIHLSRIIASHSTFSLEATIESGILFHIRGFFSEAENAFKLALTASPEDASILANLGASQVMQNRFKEAQRNLEKSIQTHPENPAAWNNLGIAHENLGHFNLAQNCFERALQIQPDMVEALENLAKFCIFHGFSAKADSVLEKLKVCCPQQIGAYRLRAALHFPPIAPDAPDTQLRRKLLSQTMDELAGTNISWSDPFRESGTTPFFLAYQSESNKIINHKLFVLYNSGPWLPDKANSFNHESFRYSRNRKIRIGFISAFFCSHTITRLNEGLIRLMDRRIFEVIIFIPASTRRDNTTVQLLKYSDQTVSLPHDIQEASQMIYCSKCHILHYCDIGMDPWTYFLAFTKSAPIQSTSWGHPDTSGIETIDYFISSSLIEPDHAQEDYTEKLICFRNPPTFFEMPMDIESIEPLNFQHQLGLCRNSHIYLCPQSLFKITPHFDDILAGILRADHLAEIIFIEGSSPNWQKLLVLRWGKISGFDLSRVHFLPRMDRGKFKSMILAGHVILDPTLFSGGVSTQEILAYGKAIVSLPSRMMRSQVTSGFLKIANLTDQIVSCNGDYVRESVKIASDLEYRRHIEEKVKVGSKHIFSNYQVVNEFESFFKTAYDAWRDGSAINNWIY